MIQRKSIVVEGKIYFSEVVSSFSSATVYVRLEDVSLADAPSRVVAQEVLRNVSLDEENPLPVSFSLRCPALDERAMYTLAVHTDVNGEGRVTPGDYITMESYPVSASRSCVQVTVHVRPVR